MKLSFVIVSKNVKKYIGGCLESVFESAKELEALSIETDVIVVDNASSDETATTASAACSCVNVIRNEYDKGFAAAANQGIEKAEGDLVFFVDPTVEILPGSVRRILDYMETNASCGIAGGKVLDQKGFTLRSARKLPNCISKLADSFGICCTCKDKSADQPMEAKWVPFTFAAIRKGMFQKLGLLDERFFANYADADLCRRAGRALNPAFKVAFIPQARVRILDKFAMRCEAEDFDLYGTDVVRARVRGEMMYFWKHYCIFTSSFFALMDIAGHSLRYTYNLLPHFGKEKKRCYHATVISETAKAMLDTQLGSQYPSTEW